MVAFFGLVLYYSLQKASVLCRFFGLQPPYYFRHRNGVFKSPRFAPDVTGVHVLYAIVYRFPLFSGSDFGSVLGIIMTLIVVYRSTFRPVFAFCTGLGCAVGGVYPGTYSHMTGSFSSFPFSHLLLEFSIPLSISTFLLVFILSGISSTAFGLRIDGFMLGVGAGGSVFISTSQGRGTQTPESTTHLGFLFYILGRKSQPLNSFY